MENITIASKKYNEDLEGFICYTNDNRYFQVQFSVNTNRLHADYNTYEAELDITNDYDLEKKFTDNEIETLHFLVENDNDFKNHAKKCDENKN